MIDLNNENFNELINNEYVLVDFYATWCGPCKMMHPVLENVSESRGEVKVVTVDVDKFPDLARTYGVMSIPTLILFKKGSLVDQKMGFIAEPLLNNWLNENK